MSQLSQLSLSIRWRLLITEALPSCRQDDDEFESVVDVSSDNSEEGSEVTFLGFGGSQEDIVISPDDSQESEED